MPLLGRGAVGGPELDVGAVPGFAIGDVNDIAGITSRGEGISAVGVLGDAPELGTGVVGSVEVDVGAVSNGGIEEVEAFTRTGVGESVSVPIGVVGKGPILGPLMVDVPDLDIGAISGAPTRDVDGLIGSGAGGDGVGAVSKLAASMELPFLSGGIVGGPEFNVGAKSARGIINVKCHTSMTGGEEGVGAVGVLENLPAFGAGVVLLPELDVGSLLGISAA